MFKIIMVNIIFVKIILVKIIMVKIIMVKRQTIVVKSRSGGTGAAVRACGAQTREPWPGSVL